MKFRSVIEAKWFRPAVGAALTVLCGLLLWGTKVGDPWENTSYDYLFRFGNRAVTNQIALILLDNKSYEELKQDRSRPWNRTNHTALLQKLTVDGARLVVFDILFRYERDAASDAELAEAMRRNGHVVLMADVTGENDENLPGVDPVSIILPAPIFLNAATSYGAARCDAQTTKTGEIARRHWPFLGPGEGRFHSLAWAAAESYGAKLDSNVQRQWLRYYGEKGPWTPATFSYFHALSQPAGCFRNKIVFIGNWPEDTDPGIPHEDKFRTPYTRWNDKAIGGVEINFTTFLNLVNEDWLRRPATWLEALFLAVTGVLIGGTLCRLRPLRCCIVAAAIAFAVMLAFVSWSYFTNYWFPWLVISGGQVPCAVAWTLLTPKRRAQDIWAEGRFPGYEVIGEPLGEGAYGKVWLVRNVLGQLQALKEIESSKFDDAGPYDREFRGITNYKPISNLHLSLLHIDHVNRNDGEGYFYYVMELGDAVDADWEQKGERYKARNLHNACSSADESRLPLRECIRICIALLEGLDFLHQQGYVHRDIKPSNVVFVKGCPKLADVGLVRSFSMEASQVGTLPYMAPEGPGKAPADIYAMGKLLYVISTGRRAEAFSEISASLVEMPGFMNLNEIICKACQPASDQRYATAAEMLAALRAMQRELDPDHTRVIQSEANASSTYSCFISYGHADNAFARWLHDRLQRQGIRCWLDEHQLLPGDDLHDGIDRGIRLWDKVLLCASKSSLTSWWVDGEISRAFQKEEQIMKERGRKVLALIPLNLDGFLFSVDYENGKKAEIKSRVAANFVGWEKNRGLFDRELEKVIRALRADGTGREEPPVSKL